MAERAGVTSTAVAAESSGDHDAETTSRGRTHGNRSGARRAKEDRT